MISCRGVCVTKKVHTKIVDMQHTEREREPTCCIFPGIMEFPPSKAILVRWRSDIRRSKWLGATGELPLIAWN